MIMRNLALALLATAAFAGCTRKLSGNGNFVNESRKVDKYNSIETDGSFEVVLTDDASDAIQIRAESNILPEIATDVQGGALIIGYKNDLTELSHADVQIKVPSHGVKSVSLAGSGSIVCGDTLRGDKLEAFLLGSGTLQLLWSGTSAVTDLSGSGDVIIKGHVNSHKITLSGSGKVHAYDLTTGVSKINISGSGDAEVNAAQTLDVVIGGSGDVRYEGSPAVTSSITGSGKVKQH